MGKVIDFDPNYANPVMMRRDAKHIVRPSRRGNQVEILLDCPDFTLSWCLRKQDVTALIKALNHAAHLDKETVIEQTFTERWKKAK